MNDETTNVPQPLLDCADVAAQLGVTATWVRDQARAGRIDHRKIGKNYRFTQDDVDTLVAKSHVVGRDPYQLSARQVAAINRGRRA